MKKLLMAAAAWVPLLLLSAGCGSLLGPETVREPVIYDIDLPAALKNVPCPVTVRLFRMEGAARYKMLFRVAENTVSTDEYNRWSMPPGQLLTRYLRMAFAESANANAPGKTVSGSILSFEGDLVRHQAVLCVKFSIRPDDGRGREKEYTVKLSVPLKADTPDACAVAMEEAAAQLAERIRKEL